MKVCFPSFDDFDLYTAGSPFCPESSIVFIEAQNGWLNAAISGRGRYGALFRFIAVTRTAAKAAVFRRYLVDLASESGPGQTLFKPSELRPQIDVPETI